MAQRQGAEGTWRAWAEEERNCRGEGPRETRSVSTGHSPQQGREGLEPRHRQTVVAQGLGTALSNAQESEDGMAGLEESTVHA